MDDPINIRRREFEVLRDEVRAMKEQLIAEEAGNLKIEQLRVLRGIASVLGINPACVEIHDE